MIGQKLGSFLIEEQIGAGAMGVVFRAVHEPTGKTAAIKIILEEAGGKSKVPERFSREADILKQCRHPNIVRWLGHGRHRGTNYFAMEFITGGTLENLLESRGPLPWKEVVAYAIDLCDALHYAHARNVIHRDLKPSNLLLTESGQLKLTDFGIAKDLDAEALTATGRTLGTAAYMAPEQIRGEPPISHKTDLYSLGCLMFQMLTGQVPFKGPAAVVMMNKHLSEKPPRVSSKTPDVPRALDDLVLTLMAKDVTRRPWDAEKVRVDLLDLKEKSDRGEPIAMVFGGGDSPSRLGASVAPTLADPSSPPPSPAPSPSTSPAAGAGAPPSSVTGPTRAPKGQRAKVVASSPRVLANPERLKTAGLVATLMGGIAVTAYLMWPPSATLLRARAEALMASDKASDWTRADREVLSELDRRFPGQFAEQKRAWRDRIALDKASRRSSILEKPNLGALSQPKTPAETAFVAVFNEAEGAIRAGDDPEAARKWRDWADALKADDPDERPWRQLALERAQAVESSMLARRATVLEMLDRSDRLVRDGKLDDARRLRTDISRRFGSTLDLRVLIRDRTGIDPSAPKEGDQPRDDAPKDEAPR